MTYEDLFPIVTAIAIGTIAAVLIWRTQRRKPEGPQPTGETYTPKHDGDLPGWDR